MGNANSGTSRRRDSLVSPSSSVLTGTCAVITGGGSGIGLAVARTFAEAGASVVLAGRSQDRLDAAIEELGPSADGVATDITEESEVRALFEHAVRRHNRVDILVNSAGAFTGGVVDDLALAEWQRVLDVNVTGMFLCAREAFRHMRPLGRGRVLNIGSIAATRPREHSVAYATSKHAVRGLTQALALDGREDGIVVSCLHPGNTAVERRVDGRSRTGGDTGAEAMMDPAEVARVAVLMASMPPDVNLLEATVLPAQQPYLGRG